MSRPTWRRSWRGCKECCPRRSEEAAERVSYDFTMMKPRPEVTIEIESLEDLGERTLLRQDPAELVEALSSLFPQMTWRKEDDGGWFGSLQGEDSWYEFRIEALLDFSWSVSSGSTGRPTS